MLFFALCLFTLSWAESETLPEAIPDRFTGDYGRAFSHYVPYAYTSAYGMTKPAATASGNLAYHTRGFAHYGLPTGGLYMTNRVAGRPIFYL